MKETLSRRVFLDRLAAGTAGTAALARLAGNPAGAASAQWAPPRLLSNPNILLIMVDQMRSPMWLNSTQLTVLNQQYLPNIFGSLRNRSYNFQQYYVAATVCTASRATLLTDLYAPQTAAYINQNRGPGLNPAFPAWPRALANLNTAYAGNCWWFGKWHLSDCHDSDPLQPYGLNTRTYPGGSAKNPSPDGHPNEGANGGAFGDTVFAGDSQIAGDFAGWLQGQAPSSGPPSSPWCATVSFVNPHDIHYAPAWLQSDPFPPQGVGLPSVYFPPPDFGSPPDPPALYSSYPSPWNYENLRNTPGKPHVQLAFQDFMNRSTGKVANWVDFLNKYYWEQSYVDRQVGVVLSALQASGQADNTVVLFTSDHGEYAGSHGLHAKGYSAYEESIRVPLYVRFPGQGSTIAMNQMCSSVDIFGLICDLGTGGAGAWRQPYPDLAARQSLWSFLYQNARETRLAPALGAPYILHTCDLGMKGEKAHIVCLRTKTDAANTAQPGAKLAVYSGWDACTTIPNGTPPDFEFYDYNPLAANNRGEIGNDYSGSNPVAAQYLDQLGSWGPPATGLIASELNASLIGTGPDGRPLTEAQAAARQTYFDAALGAGACAV